LFVGGNLWIFGLTPVGAGLSCIDSRDGGRIPDPDGVRPVWFGLSAISNFENSDRAARGITP
jgi:hypothetical protein